MAQYLAHDPTLPPISSSTVGRWLKADRIRPWRYHAWQHIHDPVAFLERARPVLEAYGQARALLRAGTWLVCLDEKTSIQAREGEQPPRPARPGKPLLHEARYHRRGARHLFAGLSVADGQVYGTCRSRKRFVEQLPCWSDKWPPLEIFLIARLLAHQHHFCSRHSFSEYCLSPSLP